MKYIALPEQIYHSAVNALGTLPANQVRGLMNVMEVEHKAVDLTDPVQVEETEIMEGKPPAKEGK